jgi:hypothetical protein
VTTLGAIARARDVGRGTSHKKVIWHACEGCQAARWVWLRGGEPQSRLCHPCGSTAQGERRRAPDTPTRICSDCAQEKPREEFHARGKGRRLHCRSCNTRRSADWRRRNRERHRAVAQEYRQTRPDVGRAATLKYRYGLTPEQFAQMVEAQGGACAICRTPTDPLSVDHCHATGRVRGLLCGNCNRMIGLGADDPEIMISAAAYLRSTADEIPTAERKAA